MAVKGPFTAIDVKALAGRNAILYRQVWGVQHRFLVRVESVRLSNQEPGSLWMLLTVYETNGQTHRWEQRMAFYLPPDGSYELV